MALFVPYQDVLEALAAVPDGQPVWPSFYSRAYLPYRPFFDGILETYGPAMFGPAGLPGAVEGSAPMLRRALFPAHGYGMEPTASDLLARVSPLLPGAPPDLYMSTLFFTAPAATLSVGGRPAIALGMERFTLTPPPGGPKLWYHPREVDEMIPHEAAHAARMQVLGLPPTPRLLSLLEMVMLEGTALTFTDGLLGRETLATFMDPLSLAWHKANDRLVRAAAARDFDRCGMEPFIRYFSAGAPVSGYYVGYSLCREYLDRYGEGAIRDLVALPSREVLARLT